MTAAETGHLVFGTLHTASAPETVDRIIDVFPHEQQQQVRTMVASALKAVISQVLLRRPDGKGRVAAHEVMLVNPAVQNLIRENKLFQIPSIMQTAKGDGMTLMVDSLKQLAYQKKITRKAACEYMNDPDLFRRNEDEDPRQPRRPRR